MQETHPSNPPAPVLQSNLDIRNIIMDCPQHPPHICHSCQARTLSETRPISGPPPPTSQLRHQYDNLLSDTNNSAPASHRSQKTTCEAFKIKCPFIIEVFSFRLFLVSLTLVYMGWGIMAFPPYLTLKPISSCKVGLNCPS